MRVRTSTQSSLHLEKEETDPPHVFHEWQVDVAQRITLLESGSLGAEVGVPHGRTRAFRYM